MNFFVYIKMVGKLPKKHKKSIKVKKKKSISIIVDVIRNKKLSV